MMVMALKLLHIAAISVWAFGLLALPVLLRQRNTVAEGAPLHRLHRAVRLAYIVVLSPAALLAIASGLALVPLRGTFEIWFQIKLLAVALLVILHLLAGSAILRVFGTENRYPAAWFGGTLVALSAVVVTILGLVLGKPPLAPEFSAFLSEPGGLGQRFPDLPGLSHLPPPP